MPALELPAYQRKENWGASETFYQLVRACASPHVPVHIVALEPCCTGRQVPENVSWTLPPQYVRDLSFLCLLNVLRYSIGIIDRQRPIPSGLGGETSISGRLSGFALRKTLAARHRYIGQHHES